MEQMKITASGPIQRDSEPMIALVRGKSLSEALSELAES
jgi:hypothetical protein